jgi:lactate dehydrogenase-like 2-hydroxyacid dehydrogenase
MARIGQAAAKRARGFGMMAHYSNSHTLQPEKAGDAYFMQDPDELVKASQFISLNPLRPR